MNAQVTARGATQEYVLIHDGSGGTPQAICVSPGAQIWTQLSDIEEFQTPTQALQRSQQLGVALKETRPWWPPGQIPDPQTNQFVTSPNFEDIQEWAPESLYSKGDYVWYQGSLWRNISGHQEEPGTSEPGRKIWVELGVKQPEPEISNVEPEVNDVEPE
jgi:hypothetical protein